MKREKEDWIHMTIRDPPQPDSKYWPRGGWGSGGSFACV